MQGAIQNNLITNNQMAQTKVPFTNYSLNQRYLAYSQSCKLDEFVQNNQTQYYNDPKKEKKGKIKKIAIISSAAVAGATILATFIGAKAGNKNIVKLLDEGRVKANGIFEEIGNLLANANNVKDDLFERLGEKLKQRNIPVLKHVTDYCSGTKSFYRSILKKSPLGSSYKQAAEILKKEGIEVEDFDAWFKKIDENILDVLHKGDNNKHFTDGLINKDLFSKMRKSIIADDVLIKNAKFKDIAGNITVPEGKVLSEEGQKALESLNSSRNKITAKLRDINAGSAATDFITDTVSLGSLGVAVAVADDKNERKNIALDLGLPLVSTLGFAFVGNLLAIAGAPCMVIGFGVGQVAKMLAKSITKKPDDKNMTYAKSMKAHQG